MRALPEISVIMLTYNREALVGRAMESMLAQTFRDFEFIIVDNGSSDRSGEIADGYAAKDGRVRVIHREKGNIGSGRNAGLDIACGGYVTFVDDDDYAEADLLEFLYGLAKTHGADIAVCGSWRETDGVKTPKYISDELLILDTERGLIELLERRLYNSANSAKLFERSLFGGVRFPERGKFDDISTIYKLFAQACRIAIHNAPKYTATRHLQNNSAFTTDGAQITPEYLEEYLGAYGERTAYLSKRFPALGPFLQYTEWSFMISMIEKCRRFNLRDCDAHVGHMRGILAQNWEAFENSPWLKDFERTWMEEMRDWT